MKEVNEKNFNQEVKSKDDSLGLTYKMEISWPDVILYTALHITAFVGIYHCFLADYQTIGFRKCCNYVIIIFFVFF